MPVHLIVSKITTIGKQPVSFGVGAHYYAEYAIGCPEVWGARAIVTFLFPSKWRLAHFTNKRGPCGWR